MANPKKIIITHKENLLKKYDGDFLLIENELNKLINFDAGRQMDTQLIYVDEATCMDALNITPVESLTFQAAKEVVDEIYNAILPAYMVIFGAQDVFPFQILLNPTQDVDDDVPTDLPYACDHGYSKDVRDFLGPTRVVGRIPDIPFQPDSDYVKTVIDTIINHQPKDPAEMSSYFSITADVWKKSTMQSLSNLFGHSNDLKFSPEYTGGGTASDLAPLVHFYNCHGALEDPRFYGQFENDYPVAIDSDSVHGNINKGTIVAAECCYGAHLYNPENTIYQKISMANAYFRNNAIAFMGSSNIAYGPAETQALADLITQYFVKFMLSGSSAGRAMLEARQKFLQASGPDLDVYELKTLAQFYLLGDPSLQAITKDTPMDSVASRRLTLFNKGVGLKATLSPSEIIEGDLPESKSEALQEIFDRTSFTGEETTYLYQVKTKPVESLEFAKSFMGSGSVKFRTYLKHGKSRSDHEKNVEEVLVIKEIGDEILGWRIYYRK